MTTNKMTCSITGEEMSSGWYYEDEPNGKNYFKYEKDLLEYVTNYMKNDPDAQFILCACMDDDKLNYAYDEMGIVWTTFE